MLCVSNLLDKVCVCILSPNSSRYRISIVLQVFLAISTTGCIEKQNMNEAEKFENIAQKDDANSQYKVGLFYESKDGLKALNVSV